MDWFGRHSRPGVLPVLFVMVLVLEGSLWLKARRQALQALAGLEQKLHERDRLMRQSPALSESDEQAIARDLSNVRNVLAAWQSALWGGEDIVPVTPPAGTIDLFFDLAAFVERTRVLAARSRVVTRPDERFGFATYVHEGPETDLLPVVHRQRLIVQYLVEALIGARPHSLVAIQRERPLTAMRRGQPATPGASADFSDGQSEDFFTMAPALSLRVPGRLDSDAYRLEFTGQTGTLRKFLNTIAAAKIPLIVRSVEVEPLEAEPSVAAQVTSNPMTLVSPRLSKVAVVVEFILPGHDFQGTPP